MAITTVLAGISVSDMERSIGWYSQLVNREVSDCPMDSVAEWRLVDGGSIQLSLAPNTAGSSRVTVGVGVDDIDALAADITDRGIPVEPVDVASGMFRIATVAHPDGNEVTFAQDLG